MRRREEEEVLFLAPQRVSGARNPICRVYTVEKNKRKVKRARRGDKVRKTLCGGGSGERKFLK